ncbi:MAG: O-antigen ligase family protein [Clostridia bacterium]|nr:O-antigen ligase family protein [Clostridia bacterium]
MEQDNKTKKIKFNPETLLCIFIVLCPILDMASFIFRNSLNTSLSPSTFIRPIIPIIIMGYLFFKNDKKFKIKSIIIGTIFIAYGIIHIYCFNKIRTLSSYSNATHEMQYLVNYSFMILNLFLFIYFFKGENTEKLRKSVFIAASIYIVSIFIAIITKTSSATYLEEQIGYKGWFESGNSICSILLLSMFCFLPLLKDKKYKIGVGIITILIGIFLTMYVGTRVGLFGFILVFTLYIVSEIIQELFKSKKINKKVTIIGIIAIIAIVGAVTIFGSTTLKRRNDLKEKEQTIIDKEKNQQSHITGDLLNIAKKIENGTLEEGYMDEAQKQSVIDLYNKANEINLKNTDRRMQQLIYNMALVKNQKNPLLIIFGNGYVLNFYELVFEMEVPAILLNFGVFGFALYLGPFIAIFLYALIKEIKNIKNIDAEFVRLFLGCGFAFALSFLSGYTFFNQSSALIIVVICALLFDKTKNLNKEN